MPQNQDEEEFQTHTDGSLHQFMVKGFRCECGCNVFHKPKGKDDIYICNYCDNRYRGE